MPQASPIGGLSLLVHILINVIIFSYNKIIKFIGLSDKNFISKFFIKLINEEGESTTRAFMSYSLIIFVLLFMVGNFVFITTRLVTEEKNRETIYSQKIENIISKYTPMLDSVFPETEFLTNNIDNISDQSVLAKKIEDSSDIYLIDFLNDLGIFNTSFENRAEIAKQVGVVDKSQEYTGSPKQNKEIILKIKDELIAHLESHVDTN